MSYCTDCIHYKVCGNEGVDDSAMTFCADKQTDKDLISRQDVEDAIAETIVNGESLGYAVAYDILSDVPSAKTDGDLISCLNGWNEVYKYILENIKENNFTQQKTDGDLISRKAVINALCALCDIGGTLKENPWRDNPHIDAVIETIERLPSAEKTAEWFPVSERLPEIHQDVLVSLRSLDVEVGFRAETEPYFYCHGDYIEPQNVLAWMPLPEPYKTESEEQK